MGNTLYNYSERRELHVLIANMFSDLLEYKRIMVLSNLPSSMRTVFELFTKHQFDVSEIAKIRNRTVKEVEMLLASARKSLKASLLGRYSEKLQ